MNTLDIEKKAKEIIKLRTERKKMQTKINGLVSEITTYMNSKEKRILKAGSYSLEIATRIRRDFDFKALDDLQAKGLISEKVMKKYTYDRLLITTGKDIELKGNRFILK
jgi:hypothetical protein